MCSKSSRVKNHQEQRPRGAIKGCLLIGMFAMIAAIAHPAAADGTAEAQRLWQNAGERAAGLDITDQPEAAYEAAMSAYREGRYHDSFAMMSDLFKASPDSEELNFAFGTSAYAIGKLSHAAVAFQRVSDLNPDNDRAKLELARTYTAMGQFTLAREIFQRVLGTSPPPAVQQNIERYLESIAEAERQWKVGVNVGAGVFLDDNANIGPRDRSVAIRPIIFGPIVFDELRVSDANRPQKAFGAFASLEARLEYDPGFRGQWSFYGSGGIYRSFLEGQVSEFDSLLLRSSLGVRKSGYAHLFDLRARIDYLERGLRKLVTIPGVDAGFVVAQNDKVRWATTASVEARNYAYGYDSVYGELGETRTRLVRDGSASWSATVAGFYENATEDTFDNAGGRVRVGARLPIKNVGEATGALGYRYSRYEDREALAPRRRQDHEWQAMAGISRPIAADTTLSLAYSFTYNESSFDLYSYDRNLLTLSMDTRF